MPASSQAQPHFLWTPSIALQECCRQSGTNVGCITTVIFAFARWRASTMKLVFWA
jgi:hypothetical protein